MISSPLIMAMLKYLWSTDFSATKARSPVSLSASVVSWNHDSIVYIVAHGKRLGMVDVVSLLLEGKNVPIAVYETFL